MLLGAAIWSLRLVSLPQLYADNLKCTSYDVDSVLTAAQYTVSYVRAVGQEASPSKCVLLSTSKAARRRMSAWRNSDDGCFWTVKLDVRDLGGPFGRHSSCCCWYLDKKGFKSPPLKFLLLEPSHWGSNACLEW